jgi:GTPase KRas protein
MALPQYQLVVLGAAGVGKSALTIQLINHEFMEEYDPTIEDSYRKQVEIDAEACQLEVLDTAGQEDDFGLRGGIEQYVCRAQGCLVVFAIDSRVSFQEVSYLRERMVKANGKVFMVLVGNKCDLAHQREVPASEGAELAKSFGCKYLETSAKSRIRRSSSWCARSASPTRTRARRTRTSTSAPSPNHIDTARATAFRGVVQHRVPLQSSSCLVSLVVSCRGA